MSKTIDMTPTWEFAVRIYIECLKSPTATAEGKRAAEEDLLRLARMVDHRSGNVFRTDEELRGNDKPVH